MKERKNITPPKWAEWLLSFYCRPELLEDLQGDLNEYFDRNVKAKGSKKAKLIYILNVLKFFRSYTLRKPEIINLLIHWIMIGSYIKTSGRNIVRNKLFSAINIIGLAASMSVGLLLISIVHDMLLYEEFHTKKNRIYRVIGDYKYLNEETVHLATTSIKAGRSIRENISGAEDLVILRHGFGGDFQFGDNILPVKGLWAEPNLFNIFTFPLLKGNPRTALLEPNSIVLTEKTAKKLFGDSDPIGKTIIQKNNSFEPSNRTYVITGILKELPKFSHMKFEALGSFSTLDIIEKTNEGIWEWNSIWSNYVYVLLPKDGAPANLQTNLDRLSDEENSNMTDHNTRISLLLQPLGKIALGKDLDNQISPNMSIGMLWFITGLSFIVLLSACFNYTNLSIARSLRRSREVGIRKVIGARKIQVLVQVLSEATIFSLIALMLAFVIFLIIRPQFLSLTPNLHNLLTLDLTPALVIYFIVLAVLIGVIAGLLPGFFYAKVNPIMMIKNVSSIRVFRHLNMRKALIATQFTFSLIFITSTLITHKQYKDFLAFDLGFNTENILNINLHGNKPEIVKKELSEIPEIRDISKSFIITSVGNNYYASIKYNDPHDSINVWYNKIDENYIPVLGFKIISGHNFISRPEDTEEGEVIVNERLVKLLNIGNRDPQKAIGEFLIMDGKKLKILGVISDFHYSTVDREIGPFMFRYSNKDLHYINAKITSSDLPGTMAKIEKAWNTIDTVHPLNATFYDDQIQQAYGEYSAMIKTIGFLACLAIIISSIGLLGMVVFSTETRLREISIRKVLGAEVSNLIYLLSKGFLFLLIISGLIAIPVTYLIFDKIVLSEVAYHSPIGFFELFFGAFAVMAIALIMIGSQTFKVARSNPAEVLKSE